MTSPSLGQVLADRRRRRDGERRARRDPRLRNVCELWSWVSPILCHSLLPTQRGVSAFLALWYVRLPFQLPEW